MHAVQFFREYQAACFSKVQRVANCGWSPSDHSLVADGYIIALQKSNDIIIVINGVMVLYNRFKSF